MQTNENASKKTPPTRTKDAEKKEKSPKAQKSSFSTVKAQTRAPYVPKCIDCKGEHLLFRYPDFDKKSIKERYDFVSSHKLCKNCLQPNHLAEVCTMYYDWV